MKNPAQEWLAGRASPPGMLACGLRGPDGNSTCHSLEETCNAGVMDQILGEFDGQRAAIFPDGLAPRWFTWVFEQGQIRFVWRPDGWLLGLVARLDSDAASKFDPLSAEFLSLELAG
jgi:hypothetical protein